MRRDKLAAIIFAVLLFSHEAKAAQAVAGKPGGSTPVKINKDAKVTSTGGIGDRAKDVSV